jgi:hypothetical protein
MYDFTHEGIEFGISETLWVHPSLYLLWMPRQFPSRYCESAQATYCPRSVTAVFQLEPIPREKLAPCEMGIPIEKQLQMVKDIEDKILIRCLDSQVV